MILAVRDKARSLSVTIILLQRNIADTSSSQQVTGYTVHIRRLKMSTTKNSEVISLCISHSKPPSPPPNNLRIQSILKQIGWLLGPRFLAVLNRMFN